MATKPLTTDQVTNDEEHLQHLASVESDALAELEAAVKEHDEKVRRIEAKFVELIGPLIENEANSRANLHNAIVDAPESLWSKRKTRVEGLCKYGWRKRRGRIVVDNEPLALERLEKHLGSNAAASHIRIKRSLDKRTLNQLAADVLRRCGVQIEADSDEVVVESTMSELAKRVEKLREDSVVDIPQNG